MTTVGPAPGTKRERGPNRRSPYQGLAPYAIADADYFFARDTWRETITDYLCAYRISILYGESGVGKSSVLRAGVVHDLQARVQASLADDGEADVMPVIFSAWSGDPVAGLEAEIRASVAALAPRLGNDPPTGPLAEVLRGWGERLGATICVIFDQFEEYFVYHRDDGGESTFASQFAETAGRHDVPAHFLIAIREDALAKLDRFQHAIPELWTNLLRIEHLDHAAATEAIERPIQRWNADNGTAIELEDGLVGAVLEQANTNRVRVDKAGLGVLAGSDRVEAPYLQLVMMRLWEEEAGHGASVLRVATLTRLGGVDQIVRRHFDQVMRALPRGQRAVAARMFRFLVTPSGTKIALPPAVLAQWSGQKQSRVARVLTELASGDHRILRTTVAPGSRENETAYEIYHDRLGAGILDWRARFRRRRARRRILGVIALVVLAAVTAAGSATQQKEQAQNETQQAIRLARSVLPGVPDAVLRTCRGGRRTKFASDMGAESEYFCSFPSGSELDGVSGPSLSYLVYRKARTAREKIDDAATFEIEKRGARSCGPRTEKVMSVVNSPGASACVVLPDGTIEMTWNENRSTVYGHATFDRPTTLSAALTAWRSVL